MEKNSFFYTINDLKNALLSANEISEISEKQQYLTNQKAVLESKNTALLQQKNEIEKATENLETDTILNENLAFLQTEITQNQQVINVNNYKPGVYILTIITQDYIMSNNFVVIR